MKLRIWVSLLFLTAALQSQEFRATISGLVSDPTGAPVANAKVTVRSLERDIVYEALSNDTGRYLTRFLPPGKYTLSAEREGFKKVVREGIEHCVNVDCADAKPGWPPARQPLPAVIVVAPAKTRHD